MHDYKFARHPTPRLEQTTSTQRCQSTARDYTDGNPSMKRLSPRALTDAWLRELTGFISREPLCLLRRHGPILMGVRLNKSGSPEFYSPRLHFHCLAIPSHLVTLNYQRGLGQLGKPMDVRSDEPEGPRHRAAEMSARFPIIASPHLGLNAFMAHAREFCSTNPIFGQSNCLRYPIAVASVMGKADSARAALDKARSIVAQWPAQALHGLTVQEWIAESERLLDAEQLRSVIDSEVKRHDLTFLPDHGLVDDIE